MKIEQGHPHHRARCFVDDHLMWDSAPAKLQNAQVSPLAMNLVTSLAVVPQPTADTTAREESDAGAGAAE